MTNVFASNKIIRCIFDVKTSTDDERVRNVLRPVIYINDPKIKTPRKIIFSIDKMKFDRNFCSKNVILVPTKVNVGPAADDITLHFCTLFNRKWKKWNANKYNLKHF